MTPWKFLSGWKTICFRAWVSMREARPLANTHHYLTGRLPTSPPTPALPSASFQQTADKGLPQPRAAVGRSREWEGEKGIQEPQERGVSREHEDHAAAWGGKAWFCLALPLLATGPNWPFFPAGTRYSLPRACEMFMGLGKCLRPEKKKKNWLQNTGKNCRIKINKCLIKCLQNRT